MPMKTMIEFWDEDPMNNVYGVVVCRPDRVLYLAAPGQIPTRQSESLPRFFAGMGIRVEIARREISRGDLAGMLHVLEEILAEEADCCFDLTGGAELSMAALGQLSAERPVPMIQFDPNDGKLVLKRNCTWEPAAEARFACKDIVNLMGGLLLDSHGHFDGRDMSRELREDSMRVWSVYRKHYKEWSTQTFYLQKMTPVGRDPLLVEGLRIVNRDNYNMVACNETILRELADVGILSELAIQEKQVRFRYKNARLKGMLSIAGLWLEIYCYLAAKESGVFQDAQISALINWEGKTFKSEAETVYNEIDVLLVRGATPVFISCKSGSVNASSLYEISVLARELGGGNARKVLATTMPVRRNAPNVANRARQMGVELVEVQDMSLEELGRKLEELSRPERKRETGRQNV